MSVSFLKREGAPALAYRLEERPGTALPPIVFLGGFRSDMEGTKAAYLAAMCERKEQTYLRFDYRGHGKSEGAFMDGTIGLWLEDALAAIALVSAPKIVLIGSSMGGWLGLLATLAQPEKIAGFIGLAAAPDFTRDMKAHLSEVQKEELLSKGFIQVPSDYAPEPYSITQRLLEEGEGHCLMDGPINITCPVRLVQGMKDTDVPWQTAHRLLNQLRSADKKVYLREQSDHRLSGAEDLALLETLASELSSGVYI